MQSYPLRRSSDLVSRDKFIEDDSIISGPNKEDLDAVVADMKKANLGVTVEGTLEDFLGGNINRRKYGSIHLTQHHIIDQIVKDLGQDNPKNTSKSTTAQPSKISHSHKQSENSDKKFHYRPVVGKLNYLEKCFRPDITYAKHQCDRLSVNPKRQHAKSLRHLGRQLKGTMDKGTIYFPNTDKGSEVHVDFDFAGNWDKEDSENTDTAISRHGFVISYKGFPIVWKSSLHTEISLSSTESEYTGL